jgi:hypothetical protein
MALADKWRRIADKYRALPAKFGLREYTVKVLNIGYTGANPGDGTLYDTETAITVGGGYPPKVRFPSQQEIALNMAGLGDCFVGPFTPNYGTGGVDRSLLDSLMSDDYTMLQFWVQGPNFPNGVAMRIKKRQVDSALRIVLQCQVVEDSRS